MNNLKFRAWHKELKKMYTVYSMTFDSESADWIVLMNDKDELITDNGNITEWPDQAGFLSEHIELMQWTGLKDGNRKDVYEGDIIKSENENETWQIVWLKKWTQFQCQKIGMAIIHEHLDFIIYDEGAKVIGNIYENPELLTSS